MPTIVQIDITLGAAGQTLNDGLTYSFAAHDPSQENVISSSGNIDLTQLTTTGDVDLKFYITTPTVTFSGAPYEVTFWPGDGSGDISIGVGQNCSGFAPYNGTEFSGFTRDQAGRTLDVDDQDNDANTYHYGLKFCVWDGANQNAFICDPEIKNQV